MIKYNPFFEKKINAKIEAELVLDESRQPIAIPVEGMKNYKIRLRVETKDPKIERVVYRLDPTYYDPVRETEDSTNNFEIETTTYGDYPVVVDVQVGNEIVRQEVLLSELLKESYLGGADEKIDDAIKDIEAN